MKAVMKKSNVTKLKSPTEKNEKLLPAKQEAALAALLTNPMIKEAVLAAGVSETTIWRYLQDEKFVSRYRAARRDAVNLAIMNLQQNACEAAKVLCQIATDETAPHSSRVAAARTIIDQAIRGVEMDEMQQRIENLEAKIKRILEERLLDAAMKEDDDE